METDASVRYIQTNKSRCEDTACKVEIRRNFQRLKTSGGITTSEEWIRFALVQGIACVADKGGSESTSIEMIFSICRMLGLRLLGALRLKYLGLIGRLCFIFRDTNLRHGQPT